MNALRGRAASICVSVGALLWASGCLDAVGPGARPGEGLSPLVVSDPTAATPIGSGAARATRAPGSASGVEVAYVSLLPGTSPNGQLATIRNLRSQSTAVVPMVGGGFDPVAVNATVGDTIQVILRSASGALVLDVHAVVAARRPPIVVRTDPPPRKRDVPLNARIIIVFSEPIAPSTLNGTVVQLRSGASAVEGQVNFADANNLVVEFVPTALLSAGTEYQLLVTQEIRDLQGQSLEAPVTVEFTTGSEAGSAASVTVDPPSLTLAPGETLPVVARAFDVMGTELIGPAVTWTSGDTAVAVISSAGMVTARSVGTTTVMATVGQARATATVGVGRLVFASVSAGRSHTCGITTDGAAYCWGQAGPLGQELVVRSGTPMPVAGGLSFAVLDAGWWHTCGITTDSVAYCWGYGASGELGNGSNEFRATPVAVAGGLRFTAVTVGMNHSCGLTADGTAFCWGGNEDGQLGNAAHGGPGQPPMPGSLTPVGVAGRLVFKSLSAGVYYTCGVTINGAVYCWGLDGGGQLGYAGPETCDYNEPAGDFFRCSTQPRAVAGGLVFRDVSAGDAYTGGHTCGLTIDSAAYCWGGDFPATPVPREVGPPVTALGVGDFSSCAVTTEGVAYCWGWLITVFTSSWFEGEFSAAPRAVPGGLSFSTVSVARFHTCGITPGRTTYCWGGNWQGELGDGSQTSTLVPVRVAGQP